MSEYREEDFSAKTARRLAYDTNHKDTKKVLDDIGFMAKKGRYELWVRYLIRPEAIKELNELGYKVKASSSFRAFMRGVRYEIKW